MTGIASFRIGSQFRRAPESGTASTYQLPLNMRNLPDNPALGPLTFTSRSAYDGIMLAWAAA